MDNILIIGSSGHAKVIIDIVEKHNRYQIRGLVDRFRNIGEKTLGYEVLGSEEDLPQLIKRHSIMGAIVAIGDNFNRAEVVSQIRQQTVDLAFVNAIHPLASLGVDVSIGEGSVIMAGASVNASCSIGRHCFLDNHSSLGHDSVMEDFSSLAPAATTAGHCQIGKHAAISIGAILARSIRVGEHAVVGAGSVVLKDVQAFTLAYGTPAKEIRERSAGEQYL